MRQVTTNWTALNGTLVFETTFAVDESSLPVVHAFVEGRRGEGKRVYVRPDPDRTTLHLGRPDSADIWARAQLSRYSQVHIDGVSNTGVFADLYYSGGPGFDEQHFEGFIGLMPQDGPPDPCPCPDPDPDPDPCPDPDPYPEPDPHRDPDPAQPYPPRIEGSSGELFPYVYVRKWPAISPEDLAHGFVQYVPVSAGSPPGDTFYDDLRALHAAGRAAMQDAALAFIDGARPYGGQFISSCARLAPAVAPLAKVETLAAAHAHDPQALRAALLLCFGTADAGAMRAWLAAPATTLFLERVWSSYFALIIILGYDRALLAQLSRLLVSAHLLGAAFASDSMPGACVLRALRAASIVLPGAVFPLPPDQTSPPAAAPDSGWIAPYAIGDLQMVRQRLVRHEPGDIAHIENVMRGERKETGRRRTQRELDYRRQENEQSDSQEHEASDGSDALLEETRQALTEKLVSNSYKDFQTKYGPPADATLSGSWTESTQQGANPGTDDVTRFARNILERSVSRIARKVGQLRASSTLDETEVRIGSTIDNSGGPGNLVAVYRWLNKVYEARVVHYGTRLMVEFMLRDPAAAFVREQQWIDGERSVPPLSLAENGIASFDALGPANYAALAALYEVSDVSPPPDDALLVSASLRGGQEQLVALAPGYCAVAAYVNTTGGGAAPPVLVGRETFLPGDAASKPRSFGESGAIAVAVGAAPLGSPPGDGTDVLVNVVIECRPGAAAQDAWRIQTYGALLAGYRRLLARFEAMPPGGNGTARAPQAERMIERRQLRRGCMALLFERQAALEGSAPLPGRPSVFSVNEAHYLQFFDDLFEWDEMSYRFHTRPALASVRPSRVNPGIANGALAPFIEADAAMVLLPVRPARVMALLYFLSSGALWDGDNRLAPVSSGDLALVNDLKSAAGQPAVQPRPVGCPWELLVPTAMQVIDSGAGADPWRAP